MQLFKNQPKPNSQVPATLTLSDVLAPGEVEVDFAHLRTDQVLHRGFFVSNYPRYVNPNWLEPLISYNHSLTISMHIYPTVSKGILDDLKHKIAEMEATIQSDLDRGKPVDPAVQVALDDAHSLQEQLVKGTERFFRFGLYIDVPAKDKEELENVSKLLQSTLGSLSITAHSTFLQMEEAYNCTLPLCQDPLNLNHNMDTTALATTFPFTSSELTDNEGIMYGINQHNDSLIIFDRFTLENANSVIFAKSGAGKSYFIKLEALRSLMFGTEIIVIDPEKEYIDLCTAVGGQYINFSPQSPVKMNPFDLSLNAQSGEDELGRKILSLIGFLKLVLGNLDASQMALLDKALTQTYRLKGITSDPSTQKNQPPLMEDLYKVLIGTEDPRGMDLAVRLERFIKGSLAGIFSSPSNLTLNNPFIVFSIRDLPEELKPLAMYLILDYIWTQVRSSLKKRLLIVDEAWYMMKHPDSGSFLVEMAKRARKYYLGVTTITQDVEDFLSIERGREIISNSSIQVLFKQAPASIEMVGKTFNLSEGEKRLLLSVGVGQGLFFAGSTHVAMQVVASPEEHQLITSNPAERLAKQSN